MRVSMRGRSIIARKKRGWSFRAEALESRALLSTTPYISEFMAANDHTLADQDGDHPDWIEIANPLLTSLSLDGYYVTDDPSDLDKWRIPAVSIEPGGYIVIFASDKNRADPAGELHTNFNLDAAGEYLALVAPDGATILSEYAPKFPEQLDDISYGIATDYLATPLISAGSPLSALVPTDDSLGASWTDPTFSDAAWISGPGAVGFDVAAPPPPRSGFTVRMVNVAGGISDVTTAQRLLTTPLPGGYSLQSDTTRDYLVVNHGPGGSFAADQILPNGLAADEEYVLHATANIVIPAGTWSVDVGSDDGFMLRIPGVSFTNRYNENYQNVPQPIAADTLTFSGLRGHAHTSATFTIPAGGLSTTLALDMYENGGGDDVELSIASGQQTFNGNFVLLSDGVLPGWSVKTTSSTPPPNYNTLIGTSLQAPMLNHNASAYLRIPLSTVENPDDFDSLRLRNKYDDGFVAYLNGLPIISRNAPDEPLWNSTATADHPDAAALIDEEIYCAIPSGLLKAGTGNILAIQGLNQTASDDDFLIAVELDGIHTLDSVQRYFTVPTPGAANDISSQIQIVADTRFDRDRGFYDSPFQVTITTATEGASIRYTTDGSAPTATAGSLYAGPITISTTTVLRAAAFKPGWRASNVDTQTYIFLNDVIHQGTNPAGFPARWTGYSTDVPADYEMDGDIVNNPTYSATMIDDLKSIPTMSIVANVADLFGQAGIYSNAGMGYRGITWERPGSIELIYPDNSEGFQVDAGLRMYGNVGSEPTVTPKHTFRLRFDQQLYGEGRLHYPLFEDAPFGNNATESFNTIILRSAFNNSFPWAHAGATYLQDAWSANTQLAMGQPSPHGIFVHLYVNGLYWGLYNPIERPDASFMASYFGGDKNDYDLNHEGEMISGDWNAWNTMMSIADAGVTTLAAYNNIKQYLDVDNLIDYLIMNFYGGNWDWDGHNWYAGRKREAGAGFKFFNWDGEGNLNDPNANITNQDRGPFTHLYLKLRENPEFRLAFADHVYKDLVNSHGALTDSVATARWVQLANWIDRAIVGETARWGDVGNAPLTRADWLNQINWRTNSFFPGHAATVVGWFRGLGLYSDVPAPEFNQDGGTISYGFSLSMTAPGGAGTIWYTVDGSDPRLPGGSVSAAARTYTAPIPLDRTTRIKARVRLSDGSWSPLHEAVFQYDMSALRVTELMYHPRAQAPYTSNDLEFIELQNTGSNPLILDGVHFTEGISFTFPDTIPDTTLGAGQRIVLIKNSVAFQSRYDGGIRIGGLYTKDLADDGETITLAGPAGETIFSFRYDDDWYPITDWDPTTDRGGYSLVAINPTADPAAFSTKDNWRPSSMTNGAPGLPDPGYNPGCIVINEVMSNTSAPQGDWIELYNATNQPINIGGWFLSNDPQNLTKYTIPPNTWIESGQYRVFTQAADFGSAFSISSAGADIYLSSNEGPDHPERPGGYREHVDFGASAPEVSFGRYVKSTGGTDFTAMSAPTMGAANALPLVGPVVISELMYNPAGTGHEFIELLNLSAAPYALHDENGNPWKFTEGVDWTFPADSELPALGYGLVVGIDPQLFRVTYSIPANVPIWGPYVGALDDGGENVKLGRPGSPESPADPIPYITVDQLHYNDSAPWPTEPDGSGPSLSRIEPTSYGNDAGNWIVGPPNGTPGALFAAPAAPTNLIGTSLSGSRIRLSWTIQGTAADGFHIERAADAVHFTRIATVGGSATSYEDAGLSSATFYTYRVRAFNNAGISPWSNALSISTPSVQVLNLIGMTDSWRFNQARADLGTAWIASDYNDTAAGWSSGQALFYNETAPLPGPKNTPLDRGPDGDRTPTFYFRKHFNLDLDPSTIASLQWRSILDDGLVFYLNGDPVPVDWLGMADGDTGYGAWSNRGVGDAIEEGPFTPRRTDYRLLRGDNVIAVEVHQVNKNSTDVVFGMSLQATVVVPTVTAEILDPSPLPSLTPVDSVQIRFSEAVTGFDLSDLRLTRGNSPNLLSPAQTLQSSDGVTWTLANLASATSSAGTYTLSLAANGSQVIGTTPGHFLGADATSSFEVSPALLRGTAQADSCYLRANGSNLEIFTTDPPGASPAYSIPLSKLSSLTIDSGGGDDLVHIGPGLPFMPTFIGGTGNDRLFIDAGSHSLTMDLGGASVEQLIVGGDARLSLEVSQRLDSVSLSGSSRLLLSANRRSVLSTASLSITDTATLDLFDNALIVRAAPQDSARLLEALRPLLASGRNAGAWNGPGISSSSAAEDEDHLTGIAAISNNRGDGQPIFQTFAGEDVDAGSILVTFAPNGDTDLNGTIDANDYFRIDSGFLRARTGWCNGDFDYDNDIDADDFALIDAAYLC